MTMIGTHTKAVLNKLTKPELVQLLLKTEATRGSQITDLSKGIKDTLTYLKKLEADIAVVKTVNNRLVERVVKRVVTLEIVAIPNSVGDSVLEETVHGAIKKIGVKIHDQDVQACHCLTEKERAIDKFVNRKDGLQILGMKKELKSFDPTESDFL